MKELAKNIKRKGWSVIETDSLDSLVSLRQRFESIIKKGLDVKLQALSFPEVFSKIEPVQLNQFFKIVNTELMDVTLSTIKSFKSTIVSLCGENIYFQRRIYLRTNIPGRDHTATPAHSDVYFGHSPFAYTIWIPMYDIVDDSGLYIFDKKESEEICNNYQFNRTLEDSFKDKHQKPPGIRIKFGQAIIFECGVVHGAHINKSSVPRVSFDLRVQSTKQPLFQKGFDLYTIAEDL